MSSGENFALLTELYHLTMAQAFFRAGHMGSATFSLFVRSYPPERGYLVAAGLDDVLDYLEGFSFDAPALEFLASKNLFSDDFLHYLSDLRFTGSVFALAEGRVCFAGAPILEVTAPVIDGQIAETFFITQIHLPSMIAGKAARCVRAAGARPVVDFALRRTHGTDAGMKVARASYIAGFAGTSNVMAGQRYGIPLVGTMAHSFISSFSREIDAFRAYIDAFPRQAILLIDTYDTLQGARNAVLVAQEMARRGENLIGVRIDSGDMAESARGVRRILDDAGLAQVQIIGSGGLDEYEIETLAAAPFDSYGVGTKMGVSADAPWADAAYKLVEYEDRAVLKLSKGKASWPGKKQVFRQQSEGKWARDIVGTRDENVAGEPLLTEAMRAGRRCAPRPKLTEIRDRLAAELATLPEGVKALRAPQRVTVEFSPELVALRDRIVAEQS